jgi:hypothetical protein
VADTPTGELVADHDHTDIINIESDPTDAGTETEVSATGQWSIGPLARSHYDHHLDSTTQTMIIIASPHRP